MTIDNIHVLKTCDPGNDHPQATEYGLVIANIYKTLNQQLMQLFAGMIKSATGKLVVLDSQLSSYESEEERERLSLKRESIRFLLREANNISAKFFINVNEHLKPGAENTDKPVKAELSLVSHEEMEEMVAITTMHANALNDFGETVSHLNARVEYLGIKNAPIFNSKAISPKGICEIYQKTLNQMEVGTEVNLELLKLFDEEVTRKLERMYSSLNQIFIDADIMPEIIHTSHDYEVPEEENTFATETLDDCDEQEYDEQECSEQEYVNNNFIPRSQAELNDIVSRFTRGNISVSGDALNMPSSKLPASFSKNPAQQNINSKQYYQRKDVVQSLNRLQKQLMEQGKNSGLNNAEEIKRSLISDIGGADSDGVAREVTVLDERNIDFVGMIFNAIADDNSISEVVSSLLTQLQIPVMKVALDDEQLFQNKAHPTRKVLNLIPRAGKGVTDTNDHLYSKIEHVVNNILAEHNVDVTSFRKAVDALHKIIHLEEESAANNEKEEQRAIIKEHARAVVVAELRKHSTGKILPKNVQPLILKHWSTLMLNRYIRHGNESELWSQSTRLCKLIIDALQPVTHKSQYEQFTSQNDVLVEVVNDELYETEQDKASIDAQISNLNNIFNQMIEKYEHLMTDEGNVNAAPVVDYYVQQEMAKYDAAVARIKQEEESVVEKVARLPAYVKPGTWFEIFNGQDGPIRRLKMSVILIETGTVVFVDRKGIKGIEKDAGVFAGELETNQSRLIADHSTFDSALGKVIAAMAS